MPRNLKKILHICIIITIIVAIAFVALILILQYSENGETNMPFDITKITIISTTDAQDVEDKDNRWNEIVSQNNDIYIDIEKNNDYNKKSIIDKIVISNLKIVRKPNVGEITIYRPSSNELFTFENKDEYKTSEIIFSGEQSTNIQNLQISNQGGRIAFRCSNDNLGTYISNDGEELNYDKLLEKIGINNDDLKATISFDIDIILTSKKSFKATVELDIPAGDVVSKGKTSIEITDLDIIFKRVEN